VKQKYVTLGTVPVRYECNTLTVRGEDRLLVVAVPEGELFGLTSSSGYLEEMAEQGEYKSVAVWRRCDVWLCDLACFKLNGVPFALLDDGARNRRYEGEREDDPER
jgi:hypothetical protein